MKENCDTFTKGKSKFPQNQGGKGDGDGGWGEGDFSVENLGLFFQS